MRGWVPRGRAAAATSSSASRPTSTPSASAAGAGVPVPPAMRRRRRRRTRVRPVGVGAAAVTRGCASRGWLAVDDGQRLLLRDPVSRAEIPLPAFDDAGRDDHITNAWHVLAFCRPGDAEWARFDTDGLPPRLYYRGLEFFGCRAYVLLANPSRLAVREVEARRLVVTSVLIRMPPAGGQWTVQERLVECDGDLLVVQVSPRVETRFSLYCIGGGYTYRDRAWYFARVD
ncbi:hypothetical protein BAE44_0000249 [Dichanthelium oligosanthes]|uniref:KIB1-4 beta-propeller domain-containing protein n=1 Tax=Dichanthelium oligosanthes TaxID=888268 RepID=A0A1E5WMW6_9POAL|nr:hypothetical protein BAE44_0000249 [Dichanthelium oligosanthes]